MHITASVFLSLRLGQALTTTPARRKPVQGPGRPRGRVDPGVGGTIARERPPVRVMGQGFALGELGRCAPEAAWAAKRSRGGRRHQQPAGWFRFAHQNLWYVGADLVSAGWLTREFGGQRRKRVLVKIIGE